jgi:hypothetical protein
MALSHQCTHIDLAIRLLRWLGVLVVHPGKCVPCDGEASVALSVLSCVFCFSLEAEILHSSQFLECAHGVNIFALSQP